MKEELEEEKTNDRFRIKLHEINGNQWYLIADKRQFILAIELDREIIEYGANKKRIKTGEYEKWLKGEMFFKNIDHAIKEYSLMKVRMSEINDFEDFAKELKIMNQFIESIDDAVNYQIKLRSK